MVGQLHHYGNCVGFIAVVLTQVCAIAAPPGLTVPEAVSHHEIPPILLAVESGKYERVRQLLGTGLDPNAFTVDYSGSYRFIADDEAPAHKMESVHTATLLILATETTNPRMVQLLIDHGAEVNARGFLWRERVFPQGKGLIYDISTGGSALHAAAFVGSRSIAALLIHHEANLNFQDYDGDTPIMVAAALQDVKMVSLLISAGASVDTRNFEGKSARDKVLMMGKNRRSDRIIAMIDEAVAKKAAASGNYQESP